MPKKSSRNRKFSHKLTNRVKTETINAGGSPRLLAIFLDVKYTTVSKWNGNLAQPSKDNMEGIGNLIERDFRDLWEPQGRVNSGLARAANSELERLHKEEGIPYEIDEYDEKTKKTVKVNNPILIKKIRDFVANYKKQANKA